MRTPPTLSTTAARIRPAVFSELQARIDRIAARGVELVPLHIGDTHLAPPEAAQRVLASIDTKDASIFRYGATAGVPALREAIAKRARLDVDEATEVLIANGGTHALFCAARAVLDAGDEVILASPYWPLAPGVFTACGAVPVDAPLTQKLYADAAEREARSGGGNLRGFGGGAPKEGDGALDPAELLAAALTPRTKAIYFISPNNPDGKVLDRAQLQRIADLAIEHELWVFADEVYADATFGKEHVSIATLDGMRERTIVLGSLSKSHALAGLRIGSVIAPEAVVAAARRVSTHSAFNVSVVMQRAAIAALEDDAFPRAACEAYRAARDVAVAALDGAPVRFHVAEGSTYLFLDFAPAVEAVGGGGGWTRSVIPDGGERPLLAILERAVDRGVLLAPGDAFGAGYGLFARLCFTSVPPDRVKIGIERLVEAIAAFRTGTA